MGPAHKVRTFQNEQTEPMDRKHWVRTTHLTGPLSHSGVEVLKYSNVTLIGDCLRGLGQDRPL